MVSSAMEVILGVSGILPNTYVERNANKMRSTIFSRRVGFHGCVSSHSDRSKYAPDKSRLFLSREKPEYLQLEPHAEIKMVQVPGSPVYICDKTHIFSQHRGRQHLSRGHHLVGSIVVPVHALKMHTRLRANHNAPRSCSVALQRRNTR